MDGVARFQLVVPDEALAPDVLGLWQAEPASVSFAPGAEPPAAFRWQVDLPADRRAAAAAVEAQAALLRRQRETLDQEALRRLHATAAGGATSFALGLPQPERDLAIWLQDVQGGQSFFWGEERLKGWAETVREAQAFVEQVQRGLVNYAWVETSVEGRRVARTTVHWLGDVATEWQAGQDRQRAALHQRAVALAVASRATWVRVFLLAAEGAAILASAIGSPLLALPAAVKFVRQVLAEVRQVQQNQARAGV
jgi:hypothetical protein